MLIIPLLCLVVSLILYLVGTFKPDLSNRSSLLKWSQQLLKQYFLTAIMFSTYNIAFSSGVHIKYFL